MSRIYRRPPPKALPTSPAIYGAWVGIVALTASETDPIPLRQHDAMLQRCEAAFTDLATSETPSVASWRDLTDVINFLQSLIELEWANDDGGWIEAGKHALMQGHAAYYAGGKVRLTGPSISALRSCIEQYDELTRAIAARSYWRVVKHTIDRIRGLLEGGSKKRGDIVIQL